MAETRSALIVDDERDIRELLVMTLGRMGLRCDTASSLGDARAQLSRNRYDLCLTDMRLPDGSGIDLISEISQQYPETPVAMITAFGNVDAAVEALKAGAFDFVAKPVELSVLRDLVRHALDLKEKPVAPPNPENLATRLYGESPAMAQLRETIVKVARSQAPVYIGGESGVGKELVARTIHAAGGRAAAPFVPVNCGAIPSELMESEFFGYRKGAASLNWPMAARCSWTRSRNCRWRCRSSCCARSRRSRSSRSAPTPRRRSTCGSCRRPTRTWPPWWPTAASARICITASM